MPRDKEPHLHTAAQSEIHIQISAAAPAASGAAAPGGAAPEGAAGEAAAGGGGLRVREWAAQWLEERRRLGTRSVGDDASRLRVHILPQLGERGLGELRPADVRAWLV